MRRMNFRGAVRFWSRHLFLLNLTLAALVWLLYGSLSLHGHGSDYWARATDLFLRREPHRYDASPGIENVLLPALAASVAKVSNAVGLPFTETSFVLLAAIPYALFIIGVARAVRLQGGSPVLSLAAAAALYGTGMVPYMTSWGGYNDGLNYLLLLPVFVWPESLAVYAIAFVLQCLTHYLGALTLLLFAFVWHSLRALDRVPAGPAAAWRYWARSFVPRAILSVAIAAAFLWFWRGSYPDASQARQVIAAVKWQDPAAVLEEVLAPFPFTVLSALKLGIIPVVALMCARLPQRRLRAAVIATPLVMAAALTFVWVDITRVATMLVMPVLLVTLHAAAARSPLAPPDRRRLRRIVFATSLAGLLVPNDYVNNGEILVPPSHAIRTALAWFAG